MNNPKLLLLKNKFLAWATKWAVGVDDNIEEIRFGTPDIVTILQALGFQIRDIDGCDPQDITVLKNGKRGMRIVLSCLYSGQRYYLEKPCELASCQAVPDEFAKVPAQSNSDLIQPPSNENQIFNKVMNEINIETDSSKDIVNNQNHSIPSESSNYFLVPSEGKTGIKDVRCDSLEQLISRDTSKERLNIKEESLDDFYTSVKKAHSDLAIAISRLEKLANPKIDKTAISPSLPTINRQKSQRQSKSIKSSTPQVPKFSTRTKSSPDLSKNGSSVKIPKSKLLSVKKPEVRKAKSNDDLKRTKGITETPRKVPLASKLYTHIKSTIPKASPLKRNK